MKTQNPGPEASSSSETELRDPGGEFEWTSSTSGRLTAQEESLVRIVNKLIREKVQDYKFEWGSIRVTAGDRQRAYMGSFGGGHSMALTIQGSAGDNSASGVVPKRSVFVVDSSRPPPPGESGGQSYTVEAFMPDLAASSGEDRQYLASLGFRLPRNGDDVVSSVGNRPPMAGGAVATCLAEPTAKDPGGYLKALISEPFNRNLVEGCCEPGSLLQRQTKASRGCRVIPVTKDDDFASEAGILKSIEHLRGPSDTLWFSAPCTGGSTWQFINLKRGPETVAKIRLHWKLFKRLWAAFEVVATHALSVGARVFVEWPRRCAYWRNSRVAKFLAKHGFVFADFDGCMYGLVATKGRDAGTPIRKPWRVACSPGTSLPTLLSKRCDGSHDHTPCAGQNTLLTQGYTPEIVDIVHRSITRDIATMNAARRQEDGGYDAARSLTCKGRAVLNVGIDEMSETVALAALVR